MPPSDISGGQKQPPGLMSLKYCKNVIGAQNMLVYFRLHDLYICQGGLMPLRLISLKRPCQSAIENIQNNT